MSRPAASRSTRACSRKSAPCGTRTCRAAIGAASVGEVKAKRSGRSNRMMRLAVVRRSLKRPALVRLARVTVSSSMGRPHEVTGHAAELQAAGWAAALAGEVERLAGGEELGERGVGGQDRAQ